MPVATERDKKLIAVMTERGKWLKSVLADMGLDGNTAPEPTLLALYKASKRLYPAPDNGTEPTHDEIRKIAAEEGVELPSEQDDGKPVETPTPKYRRRGKRQPRFTGSPKVTHPDAEPTEKQLETIRSLHEQFERHERITERGEFQRSIVGEPFDEIEGYDVLNRGEISKLLALYIPFAKAAWSKRK